MAEQLHTVLSGPPLLRVRVTEFNCIILCACNKEVIVDTKVMVAGAGN